LNDHEKKIQHASYLMMGSILLSRVIGFAREWVLAQTVGANAMTDVYYASFTIPDFLNHLMAAGALSISFVPLLATYISEGKIELGNRVFRTVATLMGALLILFIIVCEIFAESLAQLIAPGFTPDQWQILTKLLRIILPAQFFFYWGGLAIAVQYTHGRFWFPAMAPVIYNLGIITFGIFFHKTLGVMGFSIGVLVGCITSHGIIQWWGLKKLHYKTGPLLDFSPEVIKALKKYIWLTLPIMLGFSLVIADEWITKYFGSTMGERAVSWLSYARVEMRIPVAVIGQAAGIASFPYLARLWSEGSFEQYGKTLLREISKLWAAAPLAALFLFGHALPITHFIFGGSRFVAEDFQNTAKALQMFSIGVFFWTLQLILARGFYACQRTWLPSIIGTLVCFMAIPGYWYLGTTIGFQGLALAGSLGIAIYAITLWIFLRKHLRKNCPELSLTNFYKFCGLWCGVIIIAGLASQGIYHSGLYQHTQLSALLDVLVALVVIIAIGWTALRTVFVKMTDGKPLF